MKKNLIPFTPIGKSFLIEFVKEDKTESGILLPGGASSELINKDFKGYLVLATGPLCTEIAPGDTVMLKDGIMGRQVGMIVRVDGLDVTLVSFNEYDVFAIREDVEKVTEYTWKSTVKAHTTPVAMGTFAVHDNQ
jgi:co-chaperonin GroES (HSP10)